MRTDQYKWREGTAERKKGADKKTGQETKRTLFSHFLSSFFFPMS
jgi:hypothetical protein